MDNFEKWSLLVVNISFIEAYLSPIFKWVDIKNDFIFYTSSSFICPSLLDTYLGGSGESDIFLLLVGVLKAAWFNPVENELTRYGIYLVWDKKPLLSFIYSTIWFC